MACPCIPKKSDNDQAFQDWLGQVDWRCLAKFGIGLDDLPDLMTRDAFDNGVSPLYFFEQDVMRLAREQFGGRIDELEEEDQ